MHKLFKGSTFPSLPEEEGAVAPWIKHSFVEAHLYMFEQKSLCSLALNFSVFICRNSVSTPIPNTRTKIH